MIKQLYGDITSFSGDAIINSLGGRHRISYPGRIYSSLQASCDSELEKDVEENGKHLPDGGYFITDSHGLSCKKIIHIITPFKKNDSNCSFLQQTIEGALEFAYQSGLRSVCVPLIGSGYNGYSNSESFNAVIDASKKLTWEHEDYELFIFILPKKEKRRNPRGETSFQFQRAPERFDSLPPKDNYIHFNSFSDEISVGTSLGALIDLYLITNKNNFPKEFLQQNKKSFSKANKKTFDPFISYCWKAIQKNLERVASKKESVDEYRLYDRSAITKIAWTEHPCPKSKNMPKGANLCWKKPSKLSVIVAGIALKMEPSDIYFMCRFCGYYLSEYDAGDMVLKEIIESQNEEDRLMYIWSSYPKARGFEQWNDFPPDDSKTIYSPIANL